MCEGMWGKQIYTNIESTTVYIDTKDKLWCELTWSYYNCLLAVNMAGLACRGLWCVCFIKRDGCVKLLWYRSYLVWLLFGDSIRIHFLKLFFVICFVVSFFGRGEGVWLCHSDCSL